MIRFDASTHVLVPLDMSRLNLPDHLCLTHLLITSLAQADGTGRTPPITRRELAARRGVSLRSINDHLLELIKRGVIRAEQRYDGACLVLEPLSADPAVLDEPERPSVEPERPSVEPERPSVEPERPSVQLERPSVEPEPPDGRPPVAGTKPERPSVETERTAVELGRPSAESERSVAPLELEERSTLLDQEYLLLSSTLVEAGVYRSVAQRLAREPWVTLDLVRRWVAALSREAKVRNVGAVLAATLKDPDRCLPPPAMPEEPPDIRAPDPEADESAWEDAPAPEPPPRCDFDWPAAMERLRARLGDEAAEVWFGEAEPISCSDGLLVIAVPSPMARDWISNRYMRELRQIATEVAGEPLRVALSMARRPLR